jgi:hypothetical protein
MFCQPVPHALMPMSAVVVEDQVQSDLAGKLFVEATQKFQELLVPMSWITPANDTPFQNMFSLWSLTPI